MAVHFTGAWQFTLQARGSSLYRRVAIHFTGAWQFTRQFTLQADASSQAPARGCQPMPPRCHHGRTGPRRRQPRTAEVHRRRRHARPFAIEVDIVVVGRVGLVVGKIVLKALLAQLGQPAVEERVAVCCGRQAG